MDTLYKGNSGKENKLGVPRPEEVYDSGNELADEEELQAYQAMYGGRHEEREEVGLSSTQPPPPTMRRMIPFLLTLLRIKFKTSL